MSQEWEKKKTMREVLQELYTEFYQKNVEERKIFHCKWCARDIPDPYQHFIESHQQECLRQYLGS